jgi:hypothetical protein
VPWRSPPSKTVKAGQEIARRPLEVKQIWIVFHDELYLGKALSNIAGAIESGDVKASFEVIRATGLHSFAPPTGETNVEVIANRLCLEILAREHIPEKEDFLLNIGKNPRYEERKKEILEELGRTDLIS